MSSNKTSNKMEEGGGRGGRGEGGRREASKDNTREAQSDLLGLLPEDARDVALLATALRHSLAESLYAAERERRSVSKKGKQMEKRSRGKAGEHAGMRTWALGSSMTRPTRRQPPSMTAPTL